MTRSEGVERPLHDVRIWRPIADRRILALSGRTTAYSFSPVDEFVIGTVSHAPLSVRRNRKRHMLLPGQSCVWDPEHEHAGTAPAGAWSAELVIVPEGELADALDKDAAPGPSSGPEITDGATCHAIAALHRSVRLRDRLAIDVQLATIAHRLFAHGRSTGPAKLTAAADPRLRTARDLLIDRIAENVTLAELAAVAGMDRFHFARQFKAAFGSPPHTYRLHIRLLAAQRSLERGRPLTEVATTVGFFDQSHLHRHFKRRFGLSPARYAAAFIRSGPAVATD